MLPHTRTKLPRAGACVVHVACNSNSLTQTFAFAFTHSVGNYNVDWILNKLPLEIEFNAKSVAAIHTHTCTNALKLNIRAFRHAFHKRKGTIT